jgi:predicted nucleic acid-binding protein
VKVLIDTNVVLDVLLDRRPFSDPAGILFSMVEKGELSGFLGATTVTTIFYLATKVIGRPGARKEVSKLLSLFEVAPVTRAVLDAALKSRISDFEDAVLCEAATHVGADAIVTRDAAGFKASSLPVYSPEELIRLLLSLGKT